MESEIYKGFWWIDGKKEDMLNGVLSISNAGINLELFGSFHDIFDPTQGLPDETIVRGLTSNGRSILLKGLQPGGFSFVIPSAPREEIPKVTNYRPAQTYISENNAYLEDSSLTFHKLVVGITGLEVWLGNPIHVEHVNENGMPVALKATAGILRTQSVTIDGCSISFEKMPSNSGNHFRNVELTSSGSVILEFEEALSLEVWYAQIIDPIVIFLSFATGQRAHVTKLTGFHRSNIEPAGVNMSEEGFEIYKDQLKPRELGTSIILEELIAARDLAKGDLARGSILLAYQEITNQDDLESVLVNWFKWIKQLKSPFALLFSGRLAELGDRLFDNFLNIARSAEILHGLWFTDTKLSGTEFKERKESVLRNVDEDYQSWLKEILEHANRPSFRTKIVNIFNETLEVHEESELLAEDYAKLVVRTRNDLTHEGRVRDSGNWVASGINLFYLAMSLQLLLHALLIKKLGKDIRFFRRMPEYRSFSRIRKVIEMFKVPEG